MKNILLIATGGTIASKETSEGLVPQISSDEIISYVPELEGVCNIETIQLANLDSTNIKSAHWLMMAECINNNYKKYDGFVITHGTDTMAYTASALSYLIQNSKKPIVITGAQKSIYMRETDGRVNIYDAFLYAADDRACGVHLVFNGKVILGTRARKTRTKSFNAFKSIDFPEVAIIRDERIIYYIPEKIEDEEPRFFTKLNPKVFLLKMIPGLQPDIFDYLYEKYDAIVIESFGVGGIPDYGEKNFEDAIERGILKGKTIVVTTQVPHEGSDMEVYKVGYTIKEKYELLEAYNMTVEALVTKLMWILGQTKDEEKIKEMFNTTINWDIIK